MWCTRFGGPSRGNPSDRNLPHEDGVLPTEYSVHTQGFDPPDCGGITCRPLAEANAYLIHHRANGVYLWPFLPFVA